jgi:hypothetical protein
MAASKKVSPYQWTVNNLNSGLGNISVMDNTATTSTLQVGETMRVDSHPGGKVVISAPLIVDDVDVGKTLKDIMSVLGVVSRDIAREEKYKGLREAAKEYERQLDKYKTFETIKDSK